MDRDDERTVENIEAAHAPRGIPDDHLATTRMPPLPRSLPIGATSHAGPSQPLATAQPQPPKGNWWRSLIASTLPPPARSPTDQRFVDRAVAFLCSAVALVLLLVALLIGLRDAPSQSLVPASVAAAVVIARALLAVAVLAVAAMFLRMAERFFTGRDGGARD